MKTPLMKKVFDLAEDLRAKNNNLTPFNDEVRKIVGITYKTVDGVDYKLDIILPAKDGADKFPVIYFIPGGGWVTGRNHLRYGIATLFATMGAAVVLVNHRTSPKYRFPAHLVDVVDGLNFLKNIADEYKLNLDNLYVGGDSSGGHLAACTGCAYSAPEYAEKVGVKIEVPIKKMALICGAFSFEVMYRLPLTHLLIVRHFSGMPTRRSFRKKYEFYKEAHPYNYITGRFPESLVVGGMMDLLCFGEAQRMSKIMNKAGVKNKLVVSRSLLRSGHDFNLRLHFKSARKAMLQTMKWYYESQLESGIDLKEGYDRVCAFLNDYKKVIKPLRKQEKVKAKNK